MKKKQTKRNKRKKKKKNSKKRTRKGTCQGMKEKEEGAKKGRPIPLITFSYRNNREAKKLYLNL
jgi:hypothetical protein